LSVRFDSYEKINIILDIIIYYYYVLWLFFFIFHVIELKICKLKRKSIWFLIQKLWETIENCFTSNIPTFIQPCDWIILYITNCRNNKGRFPVLFYARDILSELGTHRNALLIRFWQTEISRYAKSNRYNRMKCVLAWYFVGHIFAQLMESSPYDTLMLTSSYVDVLISCQLCRVAARPLS